MKADGLVPALPWKLFGASHKLYQLRSQHVAFTERNAVLYKIHEGAVRLVSSTDTAQNIKLFSGSMLLLPSSWSISAKGLTSAVECFVLGWFAVFVLGVVYQT